MQCQKRPPTSGACSYDAAPNRKGHDRRGKGTSRSAPGPSAAKRRRTGAALAPSDHGDQSRSSSDTEQADASLPASSDDPEEADALEHIDASAPEIFDFNIDVWTNRVCIALSALMIHTGRVGVRPFPA